jgi:hypothetical protein
VKEYTYASNQYIKMSSINRIKYSSSIPNKLIDFFEKVIGSVQKETDYNDIYERFKANGNLSKKFSRMELLSIPSKRIYIATINCKTQVNLFVGFINGIQHYIIME